MCSAPSRLKVKFGVFHREELPKKIKYKFSRMKER